MNKDKKKSQHQQKGLLGYDYNYTRKNMFLVKFSLRCRINAIRRGIKEYFPSGEGRLLDLGSADGLLAEGLKDVMQNPDQIYALDLDKKGLLQNPFLSVQGECLKMPFSDNTFNIITGAALIEHLADVVQFLKECFRVLKPDGYLFLTTPDPFFEWIATKIGYLKNSGHLARYSLKEMQKLCEEVNFKVIMKEKFMITPFTFPGYEKIEDLLRKCNMSFLMMNQIIGCMKKDNCKNSEKV